MYNWKTITVYDNDFVLVSKFRTRKEARKDNREERPCFSPNMLYRLPITRLHDYYSLADFDKSDLNKWALIVISVDALSIQLCKTRKEARDTKTINKKRLGKAAELKVVKVKDFVV